MDKNETISRAAGTVGTMTLASRLFGFVRDVVIGMTFGASAAADAFFVAFRIPNIQRRILGEGAVSAAMIPVYGEYVNTRSKEDTQRFASNLFNIQTVVLVLVTLGIVLLAPLIITVFAPGFLDEPGKFELTVSLTRWMGPFLIFIGLSAYCMGLLNTHGNFALPAAAPVILNIGMIAGALFISPFLEEPIMGLAIGVLLGALLQLLVQLPQTFRQGLKLSAVLDWKDPGILKIAKLLGPAIIAFGVYEVSLLIETLLASLLPGGSISYLYYANRLVQLPLGVFGVALGIAILPTLTAQAAKEQYTELRGTLNFGIRWILFITIPATVGLAVLSFPIIQTLWERGEFVRSTTEGTQFALIFYSLGLCAFCGMKVLVSAFYSLQDTKTPMRIGVYTMILNVGLAVALMGPLQHGGLALATSLSSIANAAVLVYLLKQRLGRLGGRKIVASICRFTFAAALMGTVVYFINSWLFLPTDSLIVRLTVLLAEVFLGATVYAGIAALMKMEEWRFLVKLLKDRKARKALPETLPEDLP
ncbi:murein biosynthesis integral membrane protein MurJ [Nitrospina watsonii]|uniref:Probable lipid II flippase MurJ n=1 Tax=Nitrospina watsonii TaxID=1323948 RepID=A0ABM9HDN9_9BACT|nr:murein biosynthesis integral membrane protein MurJ [Nitrospina watsonii]CAI2718277.1 putative lipid II flippase MurJ [Nitrospina watsonii]